MTTNGNRKHQQSSKKNFTTYNFAPKSTFSQH